MKSSDIIPVVLFAYARPVHLARVLGCLRANGVPLIYAFSDGPKNARDAAAVAEVRVQLRAIDWAEVRLTQRAENMGLGRSILAGVTEVAARHEAFLVWEDDLICVPGTYAWLAAALRHYADDPRVWSVAGWTHPELAPAEAGDAPYFDARAESWVWGGYARSWRGMDEPTAVKIAAGKVILSRYGADLPRFAADEARRGTWAIRWIAHHLQHGGLCVRPARSLVEHIGDDAGASNAQGDTSWANPPLAPASAPPTHWPEPHEAPDGAAKWRRAVWRRLRWRHRLPGWFYRWLRG